MYEVPGQRYDKTWNTAPFVCGKTWLYFRRRSGRSCSIHSLQAGNPAAMADYFCVCMVQYVSGIHPATAHADRRKRTCFRYRCPLARFYGITVLSSFSNKFNIVSVLFVHQSLILSQKIDSREGLFWCKKGVACEYDEMNFYLKRSPFAPYFGLFAAKHTAFCC